MKLSKIIFLLPPEVIVGMRLSFDTQTYYNNVSRETLIQCFTDYEVTDIKPVSDKIVVYLRR